MRRKTSWQTGRAAQARRFPRETRKPSRSFDSHAVVLLFFSPSPITDSLAPNNQTRHQPDDDEDPRPLHICNYYSVSDCRRTSRAPRDCPSRPSPSTIPPTQHLFHLAHAPTSPQVLRPALPNIWESFRKKTVKFLFPGIEPYSCLSARSPFRAALILVRPGSGPSVRLSRLVSYVYILPYERVKDDIFGSLRPRRRSR